MIINTKHSLFHTYTVITVTVLSIIFTPYTTMGATTVVNNNVKVSSDSAGESQASVKTVINNEVVEDWSTTSSGSISYTSKTATSSISIDTQSESNISETAHRQQLKKLIVQLEALIKLYVSLLQS